MTCPRESEISRMFDGESREDDAVALGAHLDECRDCRAFLERLRSLDPLLKEQFRRRESQAPDPRPNLVIRRGRRNAFRVAAAAAVLLCFAAILTTVTPRGHAGITLRNLKGGFSIHSPGNPPLSIDGNGTTTMTLKAGDRLTARETKSGFTVAGDDVLMNTGSSIGVVGEEDPTLSVESGDIFCLMKSPSSSLMIGATLVSCIAPDSRIVCEATPNAAGRVTVLHGRVSLSEAAKAVEITNWQSIEIPADAKPATPSGKVGGDKICFVAQMRGFWGSTGHNIVIGTLDDLTNGKIAKVTDHDGVDWNPRLSPDGNRVAFERRLSDERSDIYLKDVSGGVERNITNHPSDNAEPRWTADGSGIVFLSDRDGARNIYLVGADGEGLFRITSLRTDCENARLSPDGERILFETDEDGRARLYTVPLRGGRPRRLTDEPTAEERNGEWSPDGKNVVLESNVGMNWDIYVVDVATGARRRLTTEPAYDLHPRYSPDGSRIAYIALENGQQDLYCIDANGGSPRRLTTGGSVEGAPSWLSDNRRILYIRGEDVPDAGFLNKLRITDIVEGGERILLPSRTGREFVPFVWTTK